MKRIVVQRVGMLSALKFGCLLGILPSVLPIFFSALGGKWSVSALRALLEGRQNVELASILGQSVRVNLTQPLGLEPVLKTLREWGGLSWLGVLLVTVMLSMFCGVLVAGMGSLLAAIYNVTA